MSKDRFFLRRKKPLTTRSQLKSETPLRKRNNKRAARLDEEQFGKYAEWIRSLPCVSCAKPPKSTASHVKGRGAGGKKKDLVPMCLICHREYEVNKAAWNRKYDLPACAEKLWDFFVKEYGIEAT